MARKYEIKTMKKDIEKLRKKMRISEPPEKLPVGPPGAPLPSEPIGLAKPPEPLKPATPLEITKPEIRKLSHPKVSRRIIVPVILVIIILLVAMGVCLLLIAEKSKLEIPVFLIGDDEIEIIELLEINIPVDVSNVLGEKYIFFLYAQEERNRAGFVNKIIDHEVLKAGLRDWENTMKEDLKPVFLGQELGEPAAKEFQDNVYQDINIRYLNFSDPLLAIDYALTSDYLIITTSRESMYRVIDRVLAQ
jgi:hypothetical protein